MIAEFRHFDKLDLDIFDGYVDTIETLGSSGCLRRDFDFHFLLDIIRKEK